MSEKTFRVYRPLVFLCGPKYNENNPRDRRRVLFDYIKDKNEIITINKNNKVKFSLIPVIVDKIFGDETLILSLKLDLKTLEEIVAAISYRTYIFLDSLSTSFEYGLFDNSVLSNKSFIFLEKGYENRKQRTVGEYITKSIPTDKLITYDFDSNAKNYREKEWIDFKLDASYNPIIPSEIKNVINTDYERLKKTAVEGFKISFYKEGEKDLNSKGVVYSSTSDYKSISFFISVRLAFYLSIMALSNPCIKKMIESGSFDNGYLIFKQYLFDLFIDSNLTNKDVNTSALITSNPNIVLRIGKYTNDYNIFKHLVFVNNRITTLLGKPIKKSVTSLRSNQEIKPSFNDINFNYVDTLFDISIKEKALIDDYCVNSNDYVERRIIRVSGKKRIIIQYKDTHKGRHLKRLHEIISNKLSLLFVPSEFAYAYKRGSNTKKCLERHLNSNYFIKLDVHSFFNSLRSHKVCRAFLERVSNKLPKRHKPLAPYYKHIHDVLKCCFYKGHIPLGFKTSPILSDIYLNDFDNVIGHSFKDVVYTRYADDILISSQTNTRRLAECERKIVDKLNEMSLSVNESKGLKISLKNQGDSIRFLGINIVKRDGYKELTISKTNLQEYAARIFKEKNKKHPDLSAIKGIVNYVHSISEKSFNHLQKTYLAIYKTEI